MVQSEQSHRGGKAPAEINKSVFSAKDVWPALVNERPSLLHNKIVALALVFSHLPVFVLGNILRFTVPFHVVPEKAVVAIANGVRKSLQARQKGSRLNQ